MNERAHRHEAKVFTLFEHPQVLISKKGEAALQFEISGEKFIVTHTQLEQKSRKSFTVFDQTGSPKTLHNTATYVRLRSILTEREIHNDTKVYSHNGKLWVSFTVNGTEFRTPASNFSRRKKQIVVPMKVFHGEKNPFTLQLTLASYAEINAMIRMQSKSNDKAETSIQPNFGQKLQKLFTGWLNRGAKKQEKQSSSPFAYATDQEPVNHLSIPQQHISPELAHQGNLGAVCFIGNKYEDKDSGTNVNEDAVGVEKGSQDGDYNFIVVDGVGGSNAPKDSTTAKNPTSRLATALVKSGLDLLKQYPDTNILQLTQTLGAQAYTLSTQIAREALQTQYTNEQNNPQACLAWGRIKNNRAEYTVIGDSRVYLIRKGKLIQLTKDHSLMQYYRENNIVSDYDADNHEQRNVVTKTIGRKHWNVEPHKYPLTPYAVDLQQGDILFACSDGFTYDEFTSKKLKKALKQISKNSSAADVTTVLHMLVNQHMNIKGAQDNAVAFVYKHT